MSIHLPPPVYLLLNEADVYSTAVLRCPCDCAICMLPIHSSQYAPTAAGTTCGGANKRDVLLSCSHLFHENCILSFERYLSVAVRRAIS